MFRAFDPEGDRLVAIKLFRIDLPPEKVHQLVAEFQRLIDAALAHPAIAVPLAAGIAGAQAYLAAEFVPADSLDIVIRDNGPAPAGHAIKVAAQLAGAIDYAAAVQISHGALQPRDILVSADDTRIVGFGIAQALERVGVTAPVRRPYAAPERIENRAWSREADIFALAAVSYELLTGRRIAGAGADTAEGLSSVPGADVDLARAVYARALAVDPQHRFVTALQFVDALKQALGDGAAEPARPRESKRSRRTVEEEPTLPLELTPAAEPLSPGPVASSVELPAAPAGELVPEPPTGEPPAAAARPFEAGGLDIAAAETERYRDVEVAPAIVPEPELPLKPDVSPELPLKVAPVVPRVEEPPAPIVAAAEPRPAGEPRPEDAPLRNGAPVSALERSRSAMWPLVLALVVGLALGFAGGYAVGTRGPSQAPGSAAVTPESTAAVTPETTAPAVPSAPPATVQAPAESNPVVPPPAGAPPAAAAPPPSAARAPAREPAKVEETAGTAEGRLQIRSTPDGARVYVDGHDRGRTPLSLRDVARGTHRIRIVRDGYTPVERRVVVTPRRAPQSVEVALERSPAREAPTRAAAEDFVGMLLIESRPTGAKVYLDNRLIGTTPMQMSGVAAGEHAVRLEHDGGYRRWSATVRVVAGERNRVTASLEK